MKNGETAILGRVCVSVHSAWMDDILVWKLVRLLKFLGVIAYGAGVGIGLSGEPQSRRRAIHLLASPALLVTWVGGYLLTLLQGTPLGEAWLLGGFSASTVGHLLLIHSTRTERLSTRQRAAVLLPLALTVLLMVLRPTWWSV